MYVLSLSSVQHKENRFFAPILGIGSMFMAYFLEHLYSLKSYYWHTCIKWLFMLILVIFVAKA